MMMGKKKSYLLGGELIRMHLVDLEQVDEALKIQKETGEFIGSTLVRLGYLTEPQLVTALSNQFELPLANPDRMSVPKTVLERVPARVAQHYHAFPLRLINGKLELALSEPPDFDLIQELNTVLGAGIQVVLAERSKIDEAIERHYGIGASIVERMVGSKKDRTTSRTSSPLGGAAVEEMEVSAGEASVRELVNQLLMDAQKKRASDIHIEPFSNRLSVRYRIDGILQEARVPGNIKEFQAHIISRIKIMAHLDISERRLPQDGRIKIRIGTEELDLRISILPSPYGEALVIRLLSPTRFLKLGNIGLSETHLKELRQILAKPSGVILLTGPTGSGKTTTLYACLSELNEVGRKIITVEDPIEYQLDGIIQMQVHPKIGLTFARGLRHMLRHDPDVMMVGEIRDPETAEIAIRSSLTGHLVFSTLHTNDAPGAIVRLLDLGIEPYLVASSVECVIAQRLIRLLCEACKKKSKEGFVGSGCERCNGTGFFGRTAIYEFLFLDEALKELVSRRISTMELREAAIKKGMNPLKQDGLAKVRGGLTISEEVLRVT